jgi:hypothetical protein
MGYFDTASSTKAISVTVLTGGFQANCMLNVIGLVQSFLNDEQRTVLTLNDAAVYGLERGNPAASMRIPELFVRKSVVHAIAFQQMFSAEELGLLPRAERIAIYTSHYVIQGDFYMGKEALLNDFIDLSKAFFIGATNVAIFPLFAMQTAAIVQAPLVYVHKDQIRMHHLV